MQFCNWPKIGSATASSPYLAVMLSAHFFASGLALPVCSRSPLAVKKSSSVIALTLPPRSSQASPSASCSSDSYFGSSHHRGAWAHASAAAAHHLQVTGKAADRRRIEAHGQPLHAVIGRHQHAGEVAAGRHAAHGDLLTAQRLLDVGPRGVGVADGAERLHVAGQLSHALGCGIDRAGDAAVGRLLRRPQRHQQIVQHHHRLPRRDADDIAAGVDLPAFARTRPARCLSARDRPARSGSAAGRRGT